MDCNMSSKMHLPHLHLVFTFSFFAEIMSSISDEHEDRFYQNVAAFEKRYQRKREPTILGDYCWNLIRDTVRPSAKGEPNCTKKAF